MSINVTASGIGSSKLNSVHGSSSIESSQKSSGENSFKDEMDKVSGSEKSEETKEDKNVTDKKSAESKEEKKNDPVSEVKDADKNSQKSEAQNNGDGVKNDNSSDFVNAGGALSLADANIMLAGDISLMKNSVNAISDNSFELYTSKVSEVGGMLTLDFGDGISMTRNDAEFFIDLAQNKEITAGSISYKAQMMLQSGADLKEVARSSQISQTLLDAINKARETNQPLRIDFDQNISVILRIGKDGSFGANFIPGDKAVEQYLKNNIETLKSTFDEKDLPYTELSYSNRGSKQQKENRKNKQ